MAQANMLNVLSALEARIVIPMHFFSGRGLDSFRQRACPAPLEINNQPEPSSSPCRQRTCQSQARLVVLP